MLKGIVTLLLLRLVAQQEDYGYSLVVRMREAGFGDMAEGTVYPALARLEQAGRLATHLVPSDKGPARKYYRITAAGTAELERVLAAWDHLARVMSDLLGKER